MNMRICAVLTPFSKRNAIPYNPEIDKKIKNKPYFFYSL